MMTIEQKGLLQQLILPGIHFMPHGLACVGLVEAVGGKLCHGKTRHQVDIKAVDHVALQELSRAFLRDLGFGGHHHVASLFKLRKPYDNVLCAPITVITVQFL